MIVAFAHLVTMITTVMSRYFAPPSKQRRGSGHALSKGALPAGPAYHRNPGSGRTVTVDAADGEPGHSPYHEIP